MVPVDPAAPPTLDELVRFLEAHELSRRKLPERLELFDVLPTTASGISAAANGMSARALRIRSGRRGAVGARPKMNRPTT